MMQFSLSGVCKSSELWKFTQFRGEFHVENSQMGSESVLYFVNRNWPENLLFYNANSSSWELVQFQSDGNSKLLALVKSTRDSLAIGSNMWTIYNDSKECNTN